MELLLLMSSFDALKRCKADGTDAGLAMVTCVACCLQPDCAVLLLCCVADKPWPHIFR
jgi:hypothetical protein